MQQTPSSERNTTHHKPFLQAIILNSLAIKQRKLLITLSAQCEVHTHILICYETDVQSYGRRYKFSGLRPFTPFFCGFTFSKILHKPIRLGHLTLRRHCYNNLSQFLQLSSRKNLNQNVSRKLIEMILTFIIHCLMDKKQTITELFDTRRISK